MGFGFYKSYELTVLVSILGRGKKFFSSAKRQQAMGTIQPPIRGHQDSFPRGAAVTYLELALRLRMYGSILLLPVYAFMACTGKYFLSLSGKSVLESLWLSGYRVPVGILMLVYHSI